jgi:hypothetical protein
MKISSVSNDSKTLQTGKEGLKSRFYVWYDTRCITDSYESKLLKDTNILNIYRTSPSAFKSVNSNVPFSALNVVDYLRSCIFEQLRKKGAHCTPSFRVVHAQQSFVFDAHGTWRTNEKLKSSDVIDMGMIDSYEELCCIIISFKT